MSGEIDNNVVEGANVIEGAGADDDAVMVNRDEGERLLAKILYEVKEIRKEVREAREDARKHYENVEAASVEGGKINYFFQSISTMVIYGSLLLNLKHEFFDNNRFVFTCLAIAPLVGLPILAGLFVQALPSLYRL